MTAPSKHLISGSVAAFIAVLIAFGAFKWGAHDANALCIEVPGFPGLLAAGLLRYGTDLQKEFVFTLVNWIFYFAVIEGFITLKRRYDN